MRRRKIEWKTLLGAFFMGAIALGLLGRALCTRSWKDYDRLRPECRIPDTIETVLYDESLDRLCVCYNDANRVNVYDGAGTFLWSVGTPWMRNSEFELLDRELVIFDGDAYRYDAVDGSFLGLAQEAELPGRHTSWTSQETRRVGPYAFDSFEVFRILPDGGTETVVARPWWHCLFLFSLWWVVAMLAVLSLGVLYLLEKWRDYRAARCGRAMEQTAKTPGQDMIGKTPLRFQSSEARFLRNYYRSMAVGQLVCAVAVPVAAQLTPVVYAAVLLPVVLHFILSGWILDNRRDRLVCERDERAAVDFWSSMRIASLIALVISTAVSVIISGA